MRFYISDLHFYHQALNASMDYRGFDSVEDMNAFMVSQWNSRVRRNDEVVILGDLSLAKGEQTNEILSQLKGKLYLIEGNHDRMYLQDKKFDVSRFEWVRPYAELHDNGRKVILCHYPVMCYNGQYQKNKSGNARSWMLYGHVHDTTDQRLIEQFCEITKRTQVNEQPIPCQMINCFCMYSNYIPLTLDEWIETDRKRRESKNHIVLTMQQI